MDDDFFLNESEKKLIKLNEQLKLLQWHKAANEAALKAALVKAKKMKIQDKYKILSKINHKEREWRDEVMKDEWNKPLQVSYDYFTDYSNRRDLDEERLDEEVRIHIENLKKLKLTLKFKEDEHIRRDVYNKKRAEYFNEGPIARARSSQKTIKNDEKEEENDKPEDDEDEIESTLDNVISNLDQLAQLEKRIEHLEKLAEEATKQVAFKKELNQPKLNDPGRITYGVYTKEPLFPSINRQNKNVNNNNNKSTKEKDKEVKKWIDHKKKQEEDRRRRIKNQSIKIQQRNEKKSPLPAANEFRQMKKDYDKRKEEILLGKNTKHDNTNSKKINKLSYKTQNPKKDRYSPISPNDEDNPKMPIFGKKIDDPRNNQ